MKDSVDKTLRDEQAGFRPNRSCTAQIAPLRIIVEQSVEWQSSLYINFIDFEKAFDSVNREGMWQLMRHYGIPSKIVTIIKVQTRKGGSVTIGGEELEEIEQFTYLGSVISKTGGTDEDINARICKARQAFAMLKPVWKSNVLSETPRSEFSTPM